MWSVPSYVPLIDWAGAGLDRYKGGSSVDRRSVMCTRLGGSVPCDRGMVGLWTGGGGMSVEWG